MPRTASASVRVLGIDPALRVTGYGVVERGRDGLTLIEAGVVAPNPRSSLEVRLRVLHEGIAEVIAQTQPHWVVLEEVYANPRNPLTSIMMGHARGVLCLAGAQAGVSVRTLAHAHVKRALTGSGAARKEQVAAMVTHLLNLRAAPSPHDVSDALALALAFLNLWTGRASIPDAG